MTSIESIISKHQNIFSAVVDFNPSTDKLLLMDFTANNDSLTKETLNYTPAFCKYVHQQLVQANALYGIGGYNEHRTIYSRSEVFDAGEEPRRLHLGIDIWGEAGTRIFAPLGGVLHSFAFNDNYGDYGATIILQHQLEGYAFHTLYGHLSLKDIQHLQQGKFISQGELIAHFGEPKENGHWPPHLHFQIIIDMELKEGDYPGVCKFSEREKYLVNCPNPDLILQMMKFAG
jgi:murein DD-endopeptidase MepM/ murein hydrolase activator NlpD